MIAARVDTSAAFDVWYRSIVIGATPTALAASCTGNAFARRVSTGRRAQSLNVMGLPTSALAHNAIPLMTLYDASLGGALLE